MNPVLKTTNELFMNHRVLKGKLHRYYGPSGILDTTRNKD